MKVKDISKRTFLSVMRSEPLSERLMYVIGDFYVLFGSPFTYAQHVNDKFCCLRFSSATSDDVVSYLRKFDYGDYWFRTHAPW